MRALGGIYLSVVTALAGCGGDTQKLPDAPPTPAADAAPDAVPTGPVTVTTHARCCDLPPGTLVADVPVSVVERDGRLGDTGTTDANGDVTLDGVEAGATIHAVYSVGPSSYAVVSVVGVEPGDHLVLGDNYYVPAVAGTDGQLTATWPATKGAYAYLAVHPCGQSFVYAPATSVTLFVYGYCQTPTAAVQVLAYDGSFNVVESSTVRGVDYAPGGTVTLDTWTAANAVGVDATAIPAVVDQSQLLVSSILGPAAFTLSAYPTPSGGTASAVIGMPTDGDRLHAWSALYRPGAYGRQEHHVGLAADAATAPIATVPLPWLGESLISGIDQRGRWVQAGTEGDGAVALVSWSHYDVPSDTFVDARWTVILPPGRTEWSWADPPAALAPYLPGEDASLNANVMVVDLPGVAGYDALRAEPEWRTATPANAVAAGDLPSASFALTYDGGGKGLLTAASRAAAGAGVTSAVTAPRR